MEDPGYVSRWAVDALKEHVESELSAVQTQLRAELLSMDRLLQERFETQTKATETAFVAAATAMQTALTAAEKAVSAALTAAERAVAKAEEASEKRFDSVNEFRAQLGDQAATFMTRMESDTRLRAADEKTVLITDRLQTQVSDLQQWVARDSGRSVGMGQSWVILVAAVTTLASLAGVILAVATR